MKNAMLLALWAGLAMSSAGLADDAAGEKGKRRHPYLLYRDLPALRKKFNDPRFANYRKLIVSAADRAARGRRGGYRHDRAGGPIGALLAGYALTADGKYRDELMKWIQASWDHRKVAGFQYHTVYPMALAYDTLHPELAPADREKLKGYLAGAVADFVAQARKGDWFIAQSFSNTAPVGCCGGGLAGLALLDEHPLAREAVDAAVRFNKRHVGACIAPDGGCVEGSLYWQYGLTHYLVFAHAFHNATGQGEWLLDHPHLRNNYRFVETQLAGDGQFFTFNDTQPFLRGIAICADFGSRFDQPLMRWMADFMVAQQAGSGEKLGLRIADAAIVPAFLWRDDKPAPKEFPGVPTLSRLERMQWGVMRSDRSYFPNLVVGVKGGEGLFTHHKQPDLGSFCLQARREMLLIDPGYYQGESAAHTLPLIDGKGPGVSGSRITDAWQRGPWRAMVLDSTRACRLSGARCVRRSLVMCADRAVVVLDDILADKAAPGKVRTLFQCGQKTVVGEDKRSAVVTGKRGRMVLRVFGPPMALGLRRRDFGRSWLYAEDARAGRVDWHELAGDYSADPDDPLVTVLLPLPLEAAPPEVEVRNAGGQITVRIAGLEPIRFRKTGVGWGFVTPEGGKDGGRVLATAPGWPDLSERVGRCVRIDAPPRIDGKLDDAAWRKCPPLSPFTDPFGVLPSVVPTDARFAYDDENLYASFRCLYPADAPPPQAVVTERDKALYLEDCVEVFLDADLDRKTYRQFVVNAIGTPFDAEMDARGRLAASWNGSWTVKVGSENPARTAAPGRAAWTVEMAIPWKTLGVGAPRPGTKMGLQIVRNHVAPYDWSQWSPTFTEYNHVPARFGVLMLQSK